MSPEAPLPRARTFGGTCLQATVEKCADGVHSTSGQAPCDNRHEQTGATPEQAADALAQALPQVVNQVSPNGQLPDKAQLDQLLGQLAGPQQ